MLPQIERLLVLQDRDRRLRRLEGELEQLPLQEDRIRREACAATERAEEVRTLALRYETERRTLELEVSTKLDFIRKCEGLQGQTRSNEEYRRFTSQIELTRKEISRLEDLEIEIMEKKEAAAKESESLSKVTKIQKDDADRRLGVLAERARNLRSEIADLEGERARLAQEIEPQTLSRYERIFETRGGAAVVGVAGGVCGGCHVKLTTQSFLTTKAAIEISSCPNCGRILYFTREMEPEPRAGGRSH